MGDIFITSDLHFNHDRDFIWKPRGFKDVQEMNEIEIYRYNSVVKPEDTCIIAGDIALGGDPLAAARLIQRLNGKKILIIGNHDTEAKLKIYRTNHLFEDIQYAMPLKAAHNKWYVTHFPTITANGEDYRLINLFGHTHQFTNDYENKSYMYHIGVDSHNCYPVNIEDIAKEIAKRKGDLV